MSLQHSVGGSGLADILERILDKGIVVAGDISVSLVGVELLTVRIRLVVASVDRALEMGIRWWEGDAALSGGARPQSGGHHRAAGTGGAAGACAGRRDRCAAGLQRAPPWGLRPVRQPRACRDDPAPAVTRLQRLPPPERARPRRRQG